MRTIAATIDAGAPSRMTAASGTVEARLTATAEPTDQPSYEMKNLVLTGRLMTEAAALRKESRGAHYRSDFPQTAADWQRHIVWKKE